MKKAKLIPVLWSLGLVAVLASCTTAPEQKTTVPDSGTSQASDSASDSSESSLPDVPKGKTGISSLIGADAAERTDILGALEKYAVDNMITGLPLFENGGYVMYNPRVVKGTENYISGYGFGILREGSLTTPLTNDEVVKPTYYNTYDTSDPGTILALNANGSQVDDLAAYISSAYFGTKMNATKTGYDWYGVLSTKDKPYIVKDGVASYPEDPEATSDTWRIYVRTGEAGGVAYRTGSAVESRRAFDGTYVTLKDYVDAFKVLLCKKFAYYRGTELSKQTGYSAIKGAKAYYDATTNGIDDAAFENVGVKSGTDTEGDYLQFTLGAPANRFYAMYALASSLYQPLNLEFFNLVTNNGANPKEYCGYSSDQSLTPVDNTLSLGSFYLESWEEEKGIAFKRNDEWFEIKADSSIYQVPGVYVNIWTAGKSDPNYGFQQFLAGKIDAAGIPLDYVAEYKDDERTTTTKGTSVFKLNVNSCTQEEWNDLFGDAGSVARLGDNAYECKPWMSNENFIRGLFYSIDRDEFAAKRGSIASINYFASNYMSDPENGIAYNVTEQHVAALEDFWGDTAETGGFSLALSQAAFNDAIDELLASGDVKANDTLSIDCWWMSAAQPRNYGGDIKEYIETAFNNSSKAKANNLKLELNNLSVDVWSDVYDKHLQVGKFDLGFGSISGNSLDPLNFMEVLKSDNSSGFTLNWGKDTSELDLVYEGETWSYNTLWAAVDHGVVTYQGEEVAAAVVNNVSAQYTEAGELEVSYEFKNGKVVLSEMEGDEDAQTILDIPEDQYSLTIKDTWLSFNAGSGCVDMSADGLVLDSYFADADSNYAYYQELDNVDEQGNLYYATYYKNYEWVGAYEDPFSESFAEVTYLDEEEESVGSAAITVNVVEAGLAATLAKTGFVAVIVDVTQVINGVESSVAVSVTVPISGIEGLLEA